LPGESNSRGDPLPRPGPLSSKNNNSAASGAPCEGIDPHLASDSFVRPSFTLEQIRTFLAVASREHVTHAARVLRLSQPAVTQQIQLLERALGVRLLERVGRNVRLTNAGVEVAGACLLVMRALENLESLVQAVRGLHLGTVSVAASPLAANYFLPPIINEFTKAYPKINVVVAVVGAEDVCQQVAAGQVECGMIDGPPTPGGNLVRTRVGSTEMVLVAHPGNGGGPGEDPPCGSRLLVWDVGSASGAIIARLLGDAVDRAPRLQIGSVEAARLLVLSAPGFVTAMPSVAVRDDLDSGALSRLCSRSVTLPIFALRRQGPDSPAVEALWRSLSTPEPNGRALRHTPE
jgi:DNA-binding transcriptional LysR family regulator